MAAAGSRPARENTGLKGAYVVKASFVVTANTCQSEQPTDGWANERLGTLRSGRIGGLGKSGPLAPAKRAIG